MTKQPEALATFAATARNDGKKPGDAGVTATASTKGLPTDPAKKADATTKVFREGVLHKDQGVNAAIDELPDRTRDS